MKDQKNSADAAQKLHDELGSHKGPSLKTGSNFAIVERIEQKIGKAGVECGERPYIRKLRTGAV